VHRVSHVSRASLAAAAVSSAALAAVLAAVVAGTTATVDQRVVAGFRRYEGHTVVSLFKVISFLGGPLARTVVVAALVAVLLGRRRWWSAGFAVVAVAGTGLADEVLKWAVARPRPHAVIPVVQADGFSFPSGHASGSAALSIVVVVLFWLTTRRRLLTFAVAGLAAAFVVLVGLSRIALGVHYPTDVVGAYALAGAWLGGVYAVAHRRMADEVSPGIRTPTSHDQPGVSSNSSGVTT